MDCPFCRNETKATYSLLVHVYHKHFLDKKNLTGKVFALIPPILIVIGFISSIIGIYQYATSTDSQKLQNIENAVVYCSLATDFENATACLNSKKITLNQIYGYTQRYENDVNKKYYLGLSYLYNNNYEAAIAYLQQALEENPLNYQIYGDLAYAYYQNKNYSASVEMGEKCMQYQKFNRWCQKGLPLAYIKLSKFESSEKLYEGQLPNLEDDYLQAMHNLAFSYLGIGKCEKAIGIYQKLAAIRKDPCEYHDTGAAYAYLGNKAEAENYYQKAKEINPNYMQNCYPENKEQVLVLNRICKGNNCTIEYISASGVQYTYEEATLIEKNYGLVSIPLCTH